MIKSIYLNTLLYYPLIIDIILISTISLPFKNKNFRPIIYITILILITLIISIKLFYILNRWIRIVLFLIVVGGLLIIILFITRICNNELISIPLNKLIWSFFKILFLFSTFIFLYLKFNFILNLNFNYFNKLNFNDYLLIDFFNNFNINIIFFLINYLFFTLICVINICYKLNLPIRQLRN